jgi:ParB-like chromosome segregation protein Spo0J
MKQFAVNLKGDNTHMQIINVKMKDITPYEDNPRRNDRAVDVVAKSIKEFGFKNPVILDKDNVIVAGHTRYRAAQRLGLDEVPAIIADDLTPEQVKAFRIMDNKSAEFAEWDYDALLKEIDELSESDYDVELTGFDMIDIEKLRLDLEVKLDGLDEDKTEQENSTDEKGAPVIQYNIIFNDEDEQEAWHEFVGYLRERYPDLETISERLVAEARRVMAEYECR